MICLKFALINVLFGEFALISCRVNFMPFQPSPMIKGGSWEKRLENWLSHFKNLLGKPATIPPNLSLPNVQVSGSLNIPTGHFINAELTLVLKSLKNKALGPDKIPVILWKDPIFHQLLLELCNFALTNDISPYLASISNYSNSKER